MKKYLCLFSTLLLFPLCASAIAMIGGSSTPTGPSGRPLQEETQPTNLGRVRQQNSVLNVQQGIKHNQQSLQNQFNGNSSTGIVEPKPPVTGNKHHHGGGSYPVIIPSYYGYTRYGQNDAPTNNNNVNVNNNIYNIYPQDENTINKNKTTKKSEVKNQEPTQDQLDEAERQRLKKKYASVLSNKTMSNEKMCSKMEHYYKNENAEELDRVLNRILRLNCDISKLRPDEEY